MVVQVIIPVTRDASKSIASVNAQSFKDYTLTLADAPGIGPGAARNIGAKESESEWLAFLDDDDTWRPDYLGTMMRYAEDADVLITSPTAYRAMTREEMLSTVCKAAGMCYGSGLMARRSFFDSVGGFNETLWCSEIWLMCLQALETSARIVSVPGVLWDRTYHREQISVRTNYESIRAERKEILAGRSVVS